MLRLENIKNELKDEDKWDNSNIAVTQTTQLYVQTSLCIMEKMTNTHYIQYQ